MGWSLSVPSNPYTWGTGFQAASADPSVGQQNQPLTAQVQYATFIPILHTVSCTTLYYSLTTSGVTTGAGVNLFGIFSATGTVQLAVSPDQTANFAAATGNKNTGAMAAFICAPPGVFVVSLANYTGTVPTLAGATAPVAVGNMVGAGITGTTATARSFSQTGATITAMPATINPATFVANQRVLIFGLA